MHLVASVLLVAASASLSQAWFLQSFGQADATCSNRPRFTLSGRQTSECLQIEEVGNIRLEQVEGEDCFMELYTTRCIGRPQTVKEPGECLRNIEGTYKWLKIRAV